MKRFKQSKMRGREENGGGSGDLKGGGSGKFVVCVKECDRSYEGGVPGTCEQDNKVLKS